MTGDDGETTAAEAPQGSAWTIVAGSFTRAGRLRAFIAAVGAIDGVTELVAERFRLGELSLRLRYAGVEPLAGCLAGLPGFWPRVELEGSGAIRLLLREGAPEG